MSLRNRSVWEWKASTLIEVAAAFRASQREACMEASENVFKVQAKVMKSTPDLEAQVESRAGAGVLRNARAVVSPRMEPDSPQRGDQTLGIHSSYNC